MAYDSSISSFTTKTDKVDLVSASHINAVQSELVTIETILGTNVKGNRADLKTRLNNLMDADGSLYSGTSFPSPSFPSQAFYRTDLDQFYIMNAAGSQWNQFGSSISNTIFSFCGQTNIQAANKGFFVNTTLTASTGGSYCYWGTLNTSTFDTVIRTKWTKISGVSTITFFGLIWVTGDTGTLKVDIGGQNNSVTTTGTSPGWTSGTAINVSSLTNGTTYDVTIQLSNNNGSSTYLGSIIGFGS
jgi:hypothetical protein